MAEKEISQEDLDDVWALLEKRKMYAGFFPFGMMNPAGMGYAGMGGMNPYAIGNGNNNHNGAFMPSVTHSFSSTPFALSPYASAYSRQGASPHGTSSRILSSSSLESQIAEAINAVSSDSSLPDKSTKNSPSSDNYSTDNSETTKIGYLSLTPEGVLQYFVLPSQEASLANLGSTSNDGPVTYLLASQGDYGASGVAGRSAQSLAMMPGYGGQAHGYAGKSPAVYVLLTASDSIGKAAYASQPGYGSPQAQGYSAPHTSYAAGEGSSPGKAGSASYSSSASSSGSGSGSGSSSGSSGSSGSGGGSGGGGG